MVQDNPYHIAVDPQDMVFLRGLQASEEMGKALRLWPEPFARRNQAPVAPTHVTIMAETEGERLWALTQLETDRRNRQMAETSLKTVAQAFETRQAA